MKIKDCIEVIDMGNIMQSANVALLFFFKRWVRNENNDKFRIIRRSH